ncbi:MAG: damage-control phosphatase ARMT1 family protein [Candidatus Helarchaeota archaeon]
MKKKGKTKKIWTEPSCASCMLNITYQIIKKSTDDKKIQFDCLKKLFQILGDFSEDTFPTEISLKIFRMLQELTKNLDPLKKEKKDSNILGKKVSELIRKDIADSKTDSDRLYKAVIGTIVGNIIDYATDKHEFNLNAQEFKKLYLGNLEKGFQIDDFDKFLALLDEINTIMYVVDNAGEIAFDRLLMEELIALKKKVIVVLKEGPISNDATMEDANEVGLDKIGVELITTGSNALGVMINEVSENFLKKLEESELIIVKGQANWETFTYYRDFFKVPILFILRTKCQPIANFLGVNIGDNVVKLEKTPI